MSFGCELDQAFGSLTDGEKKRKKIRKKNEKKEMNQDYLLKNKM
jgi:elongation factor P--beta-lysine ligase